MDFWSILEMDPTDDVRAIKAAYARLSKLYPPEEDPDQFRQLYQAYQSALAWQKGTHSQTSQVRRQSNTPLNFHNLDIELDYLKIEQDDFSQFRSIEPIEVAIPTAISQEQEAEIQHAKKVLERAKNLAKGKVLRPRTLRNMIALAKEEGVNNHLNFKQGLINFLKSQTFPLDRGNLIELEIIAQEEDLPWLGQKVDGLKKEAETKSGPWYKSRYVIVLIAIFGILRGIARWNRITRVTAPPQPAQSVISEQSTILDDMEVRHIFNIEVSLEFENGQYSLLDTSNGQRTPLPDVIKAYMVTVVEEEETSMSALATKDGQNWDLYHTDGSIRGTVTLGDIKPEYAKIIIEGDKLTVKHQSE